MDELLKALEDPEFCFFIDDYSFATELATQFKTGQPFMQLLVDTMRLNSEREEDE